MWNQRFKIKRIIPVGTGKGQKWLVKLSPVDYDSGQEKIGIVLTAEEAAAYKEGGHVEVSITPSEQEEFTATTDDVPTEEVLTEEKPAEEKTEEEKPE